MTNFIETRAKILYDPARPGMKRRTAWWCVATVDPDIARLLRWWLDRELLNPLGLDSAGLLPPSWGAHVSVVRGEKPREALRHLWKSKHNQMVSLRLSLDPHLGDNLDSDGRPFWYVLAESPELMAIRDELGLTTRFPLHLTIGRGR